MSINKVILIGRLGQNPESKAVADTTVCNFSLATSEKYKDQERTEWHNIEVWGKLAEICQKYLTKGKLVCLEGTIQTSTYEKDGEKKYRTKIRCFAMKMLDSKNINEQETLPPADDANDLPF